MRLAKSEFDGMNHPVRRLFQEHLEWRVFRWLGLDLRGLDVLEVGCGNGFGAELLARQSPGTYHGVDLMPEQIALGYAASLQRVLVRRKRRLGYRKAPNCDSRALERNGAGGDGQRR